MPINILKLLLPDKCLLCRDVTLLDVPVCPDCMEDFCALFSSRCPVCRRARRKCACGGGEIVKRERFLFYYHTPASKATISTIKHDLDKNTADFVAELIFRSLKDSKKFDCIVYPPRTRQNIRKYGFDQARVISESLSKKLRIPAADAIKRIKKATEQKLLSATQRRKNVIGTFVADKNKLAGANRVLLIDDVYTTGATIKACEAVLRAAGVAEVVPFAIAFTPATAKAKVVKTIISVSPSKLYKVKRK